MYKMRAILSSSSEEELDSKIKRLERCSAILVASYLVAWLVLISTWSFVQLSDD